jgi:hypothetical protein
VERMASKSQYLKFPIAPFLRALQEENDYFRIADNPVRTRQ